MKKLQTGVMMALLIIIACSILQTQSSNIAHGQEIGQQFNPPTKNPKLDSLIAGFLNAGDKKQYATNNGLKYENGKLEVFIILLSKDAIGSLPKDIEIERTEDNIVQSKLTVEQIINLSGSNFVKLIRAPDYATFSQTNAVSTPTKSSEAVENQDYYYLLLVIPVVIGALVIKKRRMNRSRP